MNEAWAKRLAIILMAVCVVCAFIATFLEQDLLFSLISISGFFTFRFAENNPDLLLASSWREFGERVDEAEGKALLLGSGWYFISVFLSALYIIVV